jgi:hypothetical protein
MGYKLRFPSQEENVIMFNLFKLYVEDVNKEPGIKLYFIKNMNYYTETRFNYYINMEVEGLLDRFGKPRPRTCANYELSKKNFNLWLKKNHHKKPKFNDAKYI